MKFNTRIRYGIRAMLEIASDASGSGVFQKDIAQNQLISIKYLDNIIQALKTAGLIVNVKGKKSGYILTRPPQEITMLDILNAFENGVCIIDCCAKGFTCKIDTTCDVKMFWGGLNDMIIEYFKSFTLQDFIDKRTTLEVIQD